MPTDIERKLVLLTLLASSHYLLSRAEIFKKLPSYYAVSERKADSAKKMFERDEAELSDAGYDLLAAVSFSAVRNYPNRLGVT